MKDERRGPEERDDDPTPDESVDEARFDDDPDEDSEDVGLDEGDEPADADADADADDDVEEGVKSEPEPRERPKPSAPKADVSGDRRTAEKKPTPTAAREQKRSKRGRKDSPEPDPQPEAEQQGFWERGLGKRLEGIVPDVVKRTLVGSLGSMFLSEDGLRQSLAELRLPKEIVTFILQQADHTKREFMRIVANEMRDFLESTNFYDEMRKILTSLSFEIRTEVRLIPNDSAFVKPEVKNTVRVKRDGKDVVEPEDEG